VSDLRAPLLPVLIVDDEERFLTSAAFALGSAGIANCRPCPDSREVEGILSREAFSVIVLDMYMPHHSGWDLLPVLVQNHPETPVVVMTAASDIGTAVWCMKHGAFDYLVKPVDEERLVTAVRRAVELGVIRGENERLGRRLLEGTLEHPQAFREVVTQDPRMNAIFQYIEAIAATPLPVLITGETGVGKELIARAVHAASGRKGEMVGLNIAGLDDALLADTLFGHARGSFTSADSSRKGLIERAAGGTLFLDEVGDLAPEPQVKLLRVLQEGSYYPLGSDDPRPVTARLVLSTNRDLPDLVARGTFRKDLFYRLWSHHVHVPPLRERPLDIPLLAMHFLARAAESLGRKMPTPPRELFALLGSYGFPGNVRELEGIISDAVVRHKAGVLSLQSIRLKIGHGMGTGGAPSGPGAGRQGRALKAGAERPAGAMPRVSFGPDLPTLEEIEGMLMDEALRRSDGNQTIAARLLGTTRKALNNRLRRKDAQKDRQQEGTPL
jgi:DNA-binding NtrC family response regulator